MTKRGEPCRASALAGREFCLMHDPGSAELRREAGRRGGYARSNAARAIRGLPDRPLSPDELRLVLSGGVRDAYLLQLAPGVLNAISTAAKAMLAVQEFAELEARIAALEAAAKAKEMGR